MKDQSRKTPNLSSYLGQNIKRRRLEEGLSQAKLADFLNISPQAVSKWERGTALPDIDLLIPLANIFSVTVDELLEKNDYEK